MDLIRVRVREITDLSFTRRLCARCGRRSNIVDRVRCCVVSCVNDCHLRLSEYFAYRYGGEFIGDRYGAGSGQIWLDNVRCNGTEEDITNCQHGGWGTASCQHSDDVSIACNAGIIAYQLYSPTSLVDNTSRKKEK